MRKLGWYALRVTVAAFVLGCLLLLAANLYVQSHSVQQRIHEEVEASLKMPVRLQKTTVTPWGGLRLDGIALDPDASDESGATRDDGPPDFVTVASFRVNFAWWPLLTRQRVVIEGVLIDKPQVNWQQDDDGRWSYPPGQDRVRLAETNKLARENVQAEAAVDATASPPPASAAPPDVGVATPGPGSLPAVERNAEEAAAAERFKGFPILISKLRVRHGQMTVLDRQRRPLVHLDDVNSDGAITDSRHASGAIWCGKASVPSSGVVLTDYCTAVDFGDQEGLILHDGHGEIAGGSLRTDFRIRPDPAGQTFSASARLENVALGQMARGPGTEPPLAEGHLYGNLDCHGLTEDPASRAGGGRLWLVGAKLRESAALQLVGQLLRINDLAHLEFKEANVDYKVEGTVLRIESLVLAANDVRVVARGTYRTDADRLDVRGRLTIDQAISHQLPQFIESNFTRCGAEAAGCRYMDFDVTGPASDPKCNLYDRIVAGPMKGLLDNLLAPKQKTPRNKTQGRETGAQPSPGSALAP